MRIAYLDCFAGISGDMLLGALLDAGVPEHVLSDAASAMNLGATLAISKVDRSGISACKVDVLEHGAPAGGETRQEDKPEPQHPAAPHTHPPPTLHSHEPEDVNEHRHSHEHAVGHTHASAATPATHTHVHGRSLTVIRGLIRDSNLDPAVKSLAIHAFELLGAAEAKIHNVPIDDIHFHEVGAVDAIVDIVCASAGIVHLGIGAWHASPLNVGGGMVVCAHGTFPVPAPATADLLRGFPTYSAHVQKELVTPTGAALLRALAPAFGPQPAMQVEHIGYGAGSRNPPNFPNVLRLSIGESSPLLEGPTPNAGVQGLVNAPATQTVAILETALDDSTPQLLAYVTEQALKLGALDVMLTPLLMKKGRPGTLLTVLCESGDTPVFERLLLRETTTLGIRIRQDRRSCLDRAHVAVSTPYGEVRIKTGSLGNEILNANPEFEDCRNAAVNHNVPLKQVLQAAMTAYMAR